jgi:hypothetical protein
MLTRLHGFRSGGVTFAQVAPPSRVRWMKPLSVPAQISPERAGEGAIE